MNDAIATANPYSIRNVKTFRGRQGEGFNVTLYCNGKRIAEVDDEANGGAYRFRFLDGGALETRTAIMFGQEHLARMTAAEAALHDHVATLPQTDLGDGTLIDTDAEMFVSAMVDDYQMQQAFKRTLKRPTFVVGREVRYMKGARLDDQIRAHIRTRYPSAVILNDLPFEQAFAAFKGAASA